MEVRFFYLETCEHCKVSNNNFGMCNIGCMISTGSKYNIISNNNSRSSRNYIIGITGDYNIVSNNDCSLGGQTNPYSFYCGGKNNIITNLFTNGLKFFVQENVNNVVQNMVSI